MKEWLNKYIVKGFFGWDNAKWFVREIRATFSNEPSYFARKRIESFILFLNATILLDLFCIKNWGKITSTEILAIFTAQMIYAGYQVAQIRKDIQLNKTTTTSAEQETTPTGEKITVTEETK